MSDYNFLKQAQEREESARALRMAHEEIDMLKREKAALELERDDLMVKVQRLQGRNRYLMAPIQRRESPGNWMHVSHFVALLGKWGFTPLVPDIAKEMRYALLIDTFAEILQLQKWYDNGDDKEIRKSFDKVAKILIEIGAFDSGDKRDIDFQDWDELIPKCYMRIIQFVKGERSNG